MTTRLPVLAALALALALAVGAAALTASADDWPQWRGPDRTGISKEKGLLQKWPKGGPQLLWKNSDVGIGFSSIAAVGERLYTLGAKKEVEYLLCLDARNGKELWSLKLGPVFTNKINTWGDGPRATPTVDGKHVYGLSGYGVLVCAEADGGKEVWRKDLVKDLNGKLMEFVDDVNYGHSAGPLIDGDKLICCPGGAGGTLAALNKNTGEVIWRSKEVTDQATHGSPVIAELGGVRQYVTTGYRGKTDGGVFGVSAKDGKLLWYWKADTWGVYDVSTTPIVEGNRVYVSVGTPGVGAHCLEVTRDGEAFKAEDQFKRVTSRVMKNEHGGVILIGKHVYGYSDGRGWVCQDFKTGKEAWSERDKLQGKISFTAAGGYLYLYSDVGEAVLLKASPEGWDEHGRFEIPEKAKSREERKTSRAAAVWTHPVVSNGRLYLRDQELLFCYKVN